MKKNTVNLMCIYCKSKIKRNQTNFFCKKCKKQFPVLNNSIPIFLKDKNDFFNYNFKLRKYLNDYNEE